MLTRFIGYLLLFITLICLASCSLIDKALPDHRAVVMIQTDKVLNPDEHHRPSPLAIEFYQLKAPEAFEKADYYSLVDKPEATLGGDLLEVSHVQLVPRVRSRLTLPLKEDVKYIGIVASYYDLQGVTWRLVVPMDSSWGREKFRLAFSPYGIELVKAFESEDLDVSIKKPDFNKPKLSLAGRGNMQYEVLSTDN